MIIRKTSLLLLLNCTHAFQSSPLHALALGPCKRWQASISGGETALPSTNTDEIDLYDSNNEEIPIDFTDFMQHDGEKIDEAIKDEGELMSFDDGVDDRATIPCGGFTDEEPILLSHGGGADGVLDAVVVDLESAIAQED